MKERIQRAVDAGLDEKLKEIERLNKLSNVMTEFTAEYSVIQGCRSVLIQEVKTIWEESV